MRTYLTLFLFCLSFAACRVEPYHNQKQAVRDYLESKNRFIAEEISWGIPDSIFSPFEVELFSDFLVNRLRDRIDDLLFENAYNKYGSKEYKIISDSIKKLQQEIDDIDSSVKATKEKKKVNRIGLRFEYIDKDGSHDEFIFVFNKDGKTIGHVLSIYGAALDLYTKMIP